MTEKTALLELDTRRRIYRHVERNPGLHLRGISRALAMPLGTIEYHLHQMERNGLLTSREEGRFKAFFVAEGMDRRDKDVLYYLRQEMPRRIVLHLLEHEGATHSELSGALPIGASTVSFHLKKLVAAGIVAEERAGRTKHFRVLDPERSANVLIRYRKSFLDDLVDRFARIWDQIEPAGAVPEAPDEEPPATWAADRTEAALPERGAGEEGSEDAGGRQGSPAPVAVPAWRR